MLENFELYGKDAEERRRRIMRGETEVPNSVRAPVPAWRSSSIRLRMSKDWTPKELEFLVDLMFIDITMLRGQVSISITLRMDSSDPFLLETRRLIEQIEFCLHVVYTSPANTLESGRFNLRDYLVDEMV